MAEVGAKYDAENEEQVLAGGEIELSAAESPSIRLRHETQSVVATGS